MSDEIEEYLKAELKEVAKKLLIESVDINIIYKAFTKLSKSEIDKIEVEAVEGRRRRINHEYFKMYLEDHMDDENDSIVKIYNESIEEGKRELETQIIKNMKNEKIAVEEIQKVLTEYSIEEIERVCGKSI